MLTQDHKSLFFKLLKTVDNAGTRQVLSHLWDALEVAVGIEAPPAAPPAPPSVEALQAEIAALKAQAASSAPAAAPENTRAG